MDNSEIEFARRMMARNDHNHNESDSIGNYSYRRNRILLAIEEANHETSTGTIESRITSPLKDIGNNNSPSTTFKYQTPSSILNSLKRNRSRSDNELEHSTLYGKALCTPTDRTQPFTIQNKSESFMEDEFRGYSTLDSTKKVSAWARTQLFGATSESPSDYLSSEVHIDSNPTVQFPTHSIPSGYASVNDFKKDALSSQIVSENKSRISLFNCESTLISQTTEIRSSNTYNDLWPDEICLSTSSPEFDDEEILGFRGDSLSEQHVNINDGEYSSEYCYLYGKKLSDVIDPILEEMDDMDIIYEEELALDDNDLELSLYYTNTGISLIDEKIEINQNNDDVKPTEATPKSEVPLQKMNFLGTSAALGTKAVAETEVIMENNRIREESIAKEPSATEDISDSVDTGTGEGNDTVKEINTLDDNIIVETNVTMKKHITAEDSDVIKDEVASNANKETNNNTTALNSAGIVDDITAVEKSASESKLTKAIDQLEDGITELKIKSNASEVPKYPTLGEMRRLETRYAPRRLFQNQLMTNNTDSTRTVDTTVNKVCISDSHNKEQALLEDNKPQPFYSKSPEEDKSPSLQCKVSDFWKRELETTRAIDLNINTTESIPPMVYTGESSISTIDVNSPPRTEKMAKADIQDNFTSPSENIKIESPSSSPSIETSAPSMSLLNTPLSTRSQQIITSNKQPRDEPRKPIIENSISPTTILEKLPPVMNSTVDHTPIMKSSPTMSIWMGTSISPITILDIPLSTGRRHQFSITNPHDVDNVLEPAIGDENYSLPIPQQTQSPSLSSILSKNSSASDTELNADESVARALSFYQTMRRRIKQRFRGREKVEIPDNFDITKIENPSEKVKRLLSEVKMQESLMKQANKAFTVCKSMKEFSTSIELIESERMILITSLRKTNLENEIFKELHKPPYNNNVLYKAEVTIQDISLALNEDIIQRARYKDGNMIEWFVVAIAHDEKLLMTHIVPCPVDVGSRMYFPGCFTFSDVSPDFEINITVYSLKVEADQLYRVDKYRQSNDNPPVCPSPLTLLRKRMIAEKPIEIKPAPIKPSSFKPCGNTTMYLHDLKVMPPWPLKMTSESVLYGTIDLKLRCNLPISESEAGFVNYGEKVGSRHVWNLLWCVLEGRTLSFWNYPQDILTGSPIFKIDLTYCISDRISAVPRPYCTKPRTLLIETVRERILTEKNSLIVESSSSVVVVRHLLSIDDTIEFQNWEAKLNNVMHTLREWRVMNVKKEYPTTTL